MKVIGFRCSPTCVRYAIVKIDASATKVKLLNASGENKLDYPNGTDEIVEKLVWLSKELDMLNHKHKDIDRVVIKTNEYTKDTKSKRITSYTEGIIMLAFAMSSVPVTTKTYTNLATSNREVKVHAESRVGRTEKYWNSQMADAVIAAWSGRR
ncbi:MAG: hypothetical protein OXC80_13345 [Gammaproteobacteria bacterium]|nr:hypothetical protein [Gammaproteobacteria bacterium]